MVGRNTFSPLSPAPGPQLKIWLCHPPQYDTKHVTFEPILQAAFVADKVRVVQLEPTCCIGWQVRGVTAAYRVMLPETGNPVT